MSYRESFTAEEWRTLQFAPLWTFSAVAAADGNIDDKEFAALAKELAEAPLFKDPLTVEVLMTVVIGFSEIMPAYKNDTRDIFVGLQDVASLLTRKVLPEIANGFKKAMLLIAHQVASASGGGIFGTGDKVCDAEKVAIVLIAKALNVQ